MMSAQKRCDCRLLASNNTSSLLKSSFYENESYLEGELRCDGSPEVFKTATHLQWLQCNPLGQLMCINNSQDATVIF